MRRSVINFAWLQKNFGARTARLSIRTGAVIVCALLGTGHLSAAASAQDSEPTIATMEAIAAAVGAFVVIAAVGALIYGRMVFQSLLGLRKNLETAFAELEALLKQQFDLLPGLVSVCTANMRDEPRPLLDLARSRNAWSVAQTQEEKWDAGADTNHALQQLFIESEAYPALLADDRFLRLREILKGLAAKVADRRERYNAAAGEFNTRITQFPHSSIANLAGFQKRPLFASTTTDERTPTSTVFSRLPRA